MLKTQERRRAISIALLAECGLEMSRLLCKLRGRAAEAQRWIALVEFEMTAKQKLILISILCGVVLTFFLTVIAFSGDSRGWGCTFAWQACLVQTVIHTPDNAIHEGSPIDLFGFAIGVLLGVPIYGALSYVLLLWWQRPSVKNSS